MMADIVSMFDALPLGQREQFSIDAWVIGLRAMANAHAQAQEARLADVGRTLLHDIGQQLEAHVRSQEESIAVEENALFTDLLGQCLGEDAVPRADISVEETRQAALVVHERAQPLRHLPVARIEVLPMPRDEQSRRRLPQGRWLCLPDTVDPRGPKGK